MIGLASASARSSSVSTLTAIRSYPNRTRESESERMNEIRGRKKKNSIGSRGIEPDHHLEAIHQFPSLELTHRRKNCVTLERTRESEKERTKYHHLVPSVGRLSATLVALPPLPALL